jgi:hypothetical protein
MPAGWRKDIDHKKGWQLNIKLSTIFFVFIMIFYSNSSIENKQIVSSSMPDGWRL